MELCFIFFLSENSIGKKTVPQNRRGTGGRGPLWYRQKENITMATMETSFLGASKRQCRMESPVFKPAAHHTPAHSTSTSMQFLIQPLCLQLPWQGGLCPAVLGEQLLPSPSKGNGGLRNHHCSSFLPSSLSFRQEKGQHTRCLLLSSCPALSGDGTVRGRAHVAQDQ